MKSYSLKEEQSVQTSLANPEQELALGKGQIIQHPTALAAENGCLHEISDFVGSNKSITAMMSSKHLVANCVALQPQGILEESWLL